MAAIAMDREVFYLFVICSLLVVPRILQRFRIPAPLTCLLLGVVVAELFPTDGRIVHFAAVLGITSLFLFAGLEIKFSQMRDHAVSLAAFAVIRLVSLAALTFIVQYLLKISSQAACLVALALLTSSTGFILDSLDHFGIESEDREAVANEAITGEMLALAVLFFVLQSAHTQQLLFACAELLALIVAIPIAYYALSRWVLPHAPESEFSLIVMVSIAAGFVTARLRAEYLLGSFLAGVIAAQMSKKSSLLDSPYAMHAVKLFSSFFMPFYFFRNGQQISHESLSFAAISMGLLFSLFVPLRWSVVWLRYRLARTARGRENRLALSLLPTLIFTLVLGEILRSEFNADESIIGGLFIYAFVSTLLPSLFLGNRQSSTEKLPDSAMNTNEAG
jgi:Kef-type K+ transport system membrane component KefB